MGRVNSRRTNGSRRNAVRATVLRQEDECHLCGGWVDKLLPARLDASPEVDELVPVEAGGSPYDRRNCRLAHRWCNNYRSSKPHDLVAAELRANPPSFGADGMRVNAVATAVVSRAW